LQKVRFIKTLRVSLCIAHVIAFYSSFGFSASLISNMYSDHPSISYRPSTQMRLIGWKSADGQVRIMCYFIHWRRPTLSGTQPWGIFTRRGLPRQIYICKARTTSTSKEVLSNSCWTFWWWLAWIWGNFHRCAGMIIVRCGILLQNFGD
jgi:hypothetical protein